ncbi:hypothetical protein J4407_00130 [Candidatus Pacearchaeota archaeon]|nr:hypothetical protein [Candidatus Pacearchaeota archaeon]
MKKKEIFGILAVVSLISMLLTPIDSTYWIYFLVIGIFFGILWIKSKAN